MSNPLLEVHALPPFSKIKANDIQPALSIVLLQNRSAIEAMLSRSIMPTWDNIVAPLEVLDDRLHQLWSPVSHLNSVKNSDEWREAYNACLPALTDYYTELSHNVALYKAFLSIQSSCEANSFSRERKKYIENELLAFKLSGVSLGVEEKKKYQLLQERLHQLTTKFSENVLDATQQWSLIITDERILSGVPDHVKKLAHELAQEKQEAGYYLTLDMPCYLPIMQYANDRELRKKMHYAYATRASELGEKLLDNSSVMLEILKIRREIAQLLSFTDYVEYSLQTKMLKKSESVLDFLLKLANKVKPLAEKEMQELRDFSKNQCEISTLEPWDIAYVSEKLKESCYAYSEESLRPYFQEQRVLSGLFNLVNKLYKITIREIKEVDVWDKEVRFFEVKDSDEVIRGYFYIDLYARKNKRGGAWMDECRNRRAGQSPIAYLTCNFTKPVGDTPACFTHDEVMTLFHEFGHTLHHILTTVEVPGVSGIHGVAWDAVELPSQFMENWCWEWRVMQEMSAHVETQAPMPKELFDKLVRARHFQSAMMLARQLEFSLFDILIHREVTPDWTTEAIQRVLNTVREKISVTPLAEYNRFQHSFSHIFSGGYAAGYYSYLWAEVLSSDAFARFEEEGLFNSAVGADFLHQILERGGSAEMTELYEKFRGRQATQDAFLKHRGLSK